MKKPDLKPLIDAEPVGFEPTEDDIDDLEGLLAGYDNIALDNPDA